MIVLAALLAATAAWLATGHPHEPRLERVLGVPTRRRPQAVRHRGGITHLSAALAGVGCWVVVGGVAGVVLGAACTVLLPRVLARLETRADRVRGEQLARQAPLLADLLSATLASGATLRAALAAASSAVGEPTAGVIRPVVAAVDLGAEPLAAWRAVPRVVEHVAIVDALGRSFDSGAAASDVLTRIAADLRRDHAVRVQVAARAAGVRAVAPLAACFLPAFLLLGVVPVVASLAQSLVSP